MNILIENNKLTLLLAPQNANFALYEKGSDRELSQVSLSVCFWLHGRQYTTLDKSWGMYSVNKTPAGIEVTIGPDAYGLQYRLEMRLCENQPALVARLSVINGGSGPVWLEKITLATGKQPGKVRCTFPGLAKSRTENRVFYSNGWQSWSPARVYRYRDQQFRTAYKPMISPMVDYAGSLKGLRKYQFTSDMFGIIGDVVSGQGILAGFLSQRKHFGTLAVNLEQGKETGFELWANGENCQLRPNAQVQTDWSYIEFIECRDSNSPGAYFNAVKQENGIELPTQSSYGWCSWYQYYQNISSQIIIDNLDEQTKIKDIMPIETFQIDDGWQGKVGDWLKFAPGFKTGVKSIAEEIKARGLTPGLWMAPFIVQRDAQICRDHPDYLLRDTKGKYVNAGLGWGGYTHALDLTHPGAFEYVTRVIHTAVHDWGFPYLKLDFLYAGALPGKRLDATKTGAELMHHAMVAIREAAGNETFLLGCGMPLGSGLGTVQAMRVSPDVAPDWLPKYLGMKIPFKRELTMPAVRNATMNNVMRAGMHRSLWINDPDCLLIRPNSALSSEEVQTLVTIAALTGSIIFVSDEIAKLTLDRQWMFNWLYPLLHARSVVMDLWTSREPGKLRMDLKSAAGDWCLLGQINWGERQQAREMKPEDFKLPAAKYWVRDCWRKINVLVDAGSPLWTGVLPAHACKLLAVRPFRPPITFLGSDLHISSGQEMTCFQQTAELYQFTIDVKRKTAGSIDFYLPAPARLVTVNGAPVEMKQIANQQYRLYCKPSGSTQIDILV